ncbi:MAG TPA: HAD-IA family hydrolase [Actinomycetota bacterium]
MTYRAVLFDAGETLVHPYPSFPELLIQVLREHGHETDADAVRESLPVISDRFTQAAEGGELWSTSPERSREFWDSIYRLLLKEMGLPFGDDLADSLYRTFTDISNYRVFPETVAVLEELRERGLKLGVVSNFEEWLERLLQSLDVSRFFDVQVISGIEGYEKPDTRIFKLALERVGEEPDTSVYVGDNPFFDIEPARSIGMFAVLIDRRDRFPEHDGPRITSLDELPSLIGSPA